MPAGGCSSDARRSAAGTVLAGLLIMSGGAAAQSEGWTPPEPPAPACAPSTLTVEPVVSYRVSELCRITGVQVEGEYLYGAGEVKEQVRGFESETTTRRFEMGTYRHLREITIELRRVMEPPETLVCHLDMMDRAVIDARLESAGGGSRPVEVAGGRLPDLGTFTHSTRLLRPMEDCPP